MKENCLDVSSCPGPRCLDNIIQVCDYVNGSNLRIVEIYSSGGRLNIKVTREITCVKTAVLFIKDVNNLLEKDKQQEDRNSTHVLRHTISVVSTAITYLITSY